MLQHFSFMKSARENRADCHLTTRIVRQPSHYSRGTRNEHTRRRELSGTPRTFTGSPRPFLFPMKCARVRPVWRHDIMKNQSMSRRRAAIDPDLDPLLDSVSILPRAMRPTQELTSVSRLNRRVATSVANDVECGYPLVREPTGSFRIPSRTDMTA